MTRATTVPLRNERTVGVCAYCPNEGRLYPAGWRCPAHAPTQAVGP